MSASYLIKYGIWHNYATGTWTLTATPTNAGYLSAALVVWVGLVASSSWDLFKYILHQMGTKQAARHVMVEQRLISLRTSQEGLAYPLLLMKMLWRWGHTPNQLNRHLSAILGILLVTIIHYSGWTASKVFVSLIWTSPSSDVLLASSNFCGNILWQGSDALQINQLFRQYQINGSLVAQTRVDQCSSANPDPLVCSLFPTVKLPWTAQNTTCPFASNSLCISTNSTPVQMVTDRINSGIHLGIDAPQKDTVDIRRMTVCSPVTLRPFVSTINASSTPNPWSFPPGSTIRRVALGPLLDGDMIIGNYTYQFVNWTGTVTNGFELDTYAYYPLSGGSQFWAPNSTFFNRKDAIASIFFLALNNVAFDNPVYDPWFSASGNPVNVPNYATKYYGDFDFTGLGCTDQYQVCQPSMPDSIGCSSYTTATGLDIAAESNNLKFSNIQQSTILRLSSALFLTDMSATVTGRETSALLASRNVAKIVGGELPIDQWRREMANLFQVGLNRFQQAIISFASGPLVPELYQYVVSPPSKMLTDQCKSQRINLGGAHLGRQNFNFEAILIVLGVGLLIMALGQLLPPAVDTILERYGNEVARYKAMRWNVDQTLQIHRLAHERNGVTLWEHAKADVPSCDAEIQPLNNREQHPLLGPSGREFASENEFAVFGQQNGTDEALLRHNRQHE